MHFIRFIKIFAYIYLVIVLVIITGLVYFVRNFSTDEQVVTQKVNIDKTVDEKPTSTPKPTLPPIPVSYEIPLQKHVYQTFNNCGPASMSMALSYFDIEASQSELGEILRPFQNAIGDNDDKSVTMSEIADLAPEYGLMAYHRPAGDMGIIKKLVANDLPVLVRTMLSTEEDIGHYRLIRGYTEKELIQDDSLQGKDIYYNTEDFKKIWEYFNYEFVVLYPEEKKAVVDIILDDLVNEEFAWQKSVNISRNILSANPNDINAKFNLSVAFYHLGDYQRSVDIFEEVENQLSFRTLWYQIEPIKSYYELEKYNKVFEITDQILNNHNRAFSELYIIRGDIYKKQGNLNLAKQEYERAILYNQSLEIPKKRLESLK